MKRNIAAATIFSFITCGIYLLYWMYMLTEELNRMADKKEYANGVTVVVVTMATFGLYGYVWALQMSRNMDTIAKAHGDRPLKFGILFLFLQLLFLPIVNCALMQNTINKYAIDV